METTYTCFFNKEEEEEDDDFLSNLDNMPTDNCFIIHLKYIHSLHELTFQEQIHVSSSSSFESFLLPFDELLTNTSTILYTMLSNYNIPETFIDNLSLELFNFATTMIVNALPHDTSIEGPQILPMTLLVFAKSSYHNDVQEFERVLEESINDVQEHERILEESINDVHANLSTTIDEILKKVDIKSSSSSSSVTENMCTICLEDLSSQGLNMENNDDKIVSTPCSHVYHKDCIVRWLETSGSCPLCRFTMI